MQNIYFIRIFLKSGEIYDGLFGLLSRHHYAFPAFKLQDKPNFSSTTMIYKIHPCHQNSSIQQHNRTLFIDTSEYKNEILHYLTHCTWRRGDAVFKLAFWSWFTILAANLSTIYLSTDNRTRVISLIISTLCH